MRNSAPEMVLMISRIALQNILDYEWIADADDEWIADATGWPESNRLVLYLRMDIS